MKLLSEIGAIIIGVISGLWFYSQPGYEPLIVFLSAIGVTISQMYIRFRNRDVSSLLGKLLSPIIIWKERKTSIAKIAFDTLWDVKAVKHEINAFNIWDDVGPTGQVELRHKVSNGSWYTFVIVDGHHIEFKAIDLNADGNPELLVSYCCGAHTRAIKIFCVVLGGKLELIPRSDVGSDWPDLEVDDRDGDGVSEIYAKQRNWSGDPPSEYIEEIFHYNGGSYSKLEEAEGHVSHFPL